MCEAKLMRIVGNVMSISLPTGYLMSICHSFTMPGEE
jgi:hypothetical protein